MRIFADNMERKWHTGGSHSPGFLCDKGLFDVNIEISAEMGYETLSGYGMDV